MRRAIARGRVFPQSYSTDRRYGRLSLKACALFPLMWANADDQGRLPGDPEEIKYAVCPNIDHITKTDIPELLEELDQNQLIKVYTTSKMEAIQILDWWDVHRPQWAWPSQYPPPEGWQDHLRYKKGAKTVVTENWFVPSESSGEHTSDSQVSDEPISGESSGEQSPQRFLTTPKETEKETERGKRKLKEEEEIHLSAQVRKQPSPSPTTLPTEFEILDRLKQCFQREWGRVLAERPDEIIPRALTARESAQLRDLAKELYAAGGCLLETIDEAFQHVAQYPDKMHVSYVADVLRAWLGIERNRSP